MKREAGFYWVRLNDEWLIAEWWDNSCWLMTGTEYNFPDAEFEEIGSKVEKV